MIQSQPNLAGKPNPDDGLLMPHDGRFPAAFSALSSPPSQLYFKGDLSLLDRPIIAIVGSRHPTEQGKLDATAFARDLSRAGYVIVSGLAMGIDAAAHQGGMMGPSLSVAIMGTGINRLYPRENLALGQRMLADGGLILSEFEPNAPAKAWHFPHRNRLIASLCLGCLVVEATLESGSLITAQLALELGKEVFALPGSIHSTLSKGCHHLIKEGAKLVENIMDILQELPPGTHLSNPHSAYLTPHQPLSDDFPCEESYKLWQNMPYVPMSMDRLARLNALTLSQLALLVTSMEIAGYVALLPGGMIQKLIKSS